MSPFRIIGPASMAVCISSPVRSRKPVLMNTTRSLAARMHSLRFTLVRRSSSMMPILSVFSRIPSVRSTRANSSAAKATSSGPCILGLTMYIEPAREFMRRPPPPAPSPPVSPLSPPLPMSCMAHSAVTWASRMPSGTSRPPASSTAGVVIRWPTLRTSISARPGRRVSAKPKGFLSVTSSFSSRTKVSPPFFTSTFRSPRIRPSQLA